LELDKRAIKNGVNSIIIDNGELSEIEPYAATYQKALYTPDTAVIDPGEILRELVRDINSSGKARVLCGYSFLNLKNDHTAVTSHGLIEFKKFVNASGAYADRVAYQFGVGNEYRILPFKGTYKKLRKDRSHLVRGNIYPLPDLKNTFLGVHFTRGVDNTVYAGPTAIPAFGRENYRFFDDISLETFSIILREGILLFDNESFRIAAFSEVKKYSKRFFFKEAKTLLNDLQMSDLEDTDKVGIRPQLIHWPSKKLVMDFVLLRERESIHVLNAISPAFTSSMAFARFAVDNLLE
jgi:(S)-2-hydroxyglutarate dehydrogenase